MKNGIVNAPISFWDFIKENQIQIPIIQRDYAQGREDKVDLRRDFLNEIKEHLEKQDILLLDFVYGTDRNGIQPLDGQQRLTTLWLLHWYYSFKKGKKENVEVLRKFTYKTRISSREFIKNLCSLLESGDNCKDKDIAEFIKSQTWFSYSWKQDPTIQAMLIMLSGTESSEGIPNNDGIDYIFGGNVDILEKLFVDCPIKFYYLPLEGIKQSDDLYVKMNHRGEQLTDFENFKADWVGFMRKNTELKIYVTVGDDYILAKLDTDWADLFWKPEELDLKKNLGLSDEEHDDLETDDLFFSFIKLLLVDSLYSNYEINRSYIKTIEGQHNLKYTSFKIYESVVTKGTIENLQKILDKIPKEFNQLIADAIPLIRNSDFIFLPEHRKKDDENKTLVIKYPTSAKERVLFHSICQFLIHSEEKIHDNKGCLTPNFKQWLRLSTNFAYSRVIESEKQIIPRIKLVDTVAKYLTDKGWTNVYSVMKVYTDEESIIKQEINKINIIQSNPSSEKGLLELEGMTLFNGWIDCFLENICISCTIINQTNCHHHYSIFEREFCVFNDNEWTKAEKDKLYKLLKACLTEYSKENSSNINLEFTSMHDGYQKTFSGVLKQSFKKVMEKLLQGRTIDDIIDEYKKDPSRNNGWFTPLILDDNNVLWNYAQNGYIREKNDKKMYVYFKQNSNQNKDIELVSFYKCLSDKEIDVKNIKSIEKKDKEWRLKELNGTEFAMTESYSI